MLHQRVFPLKKVKRKTEILFRPAESVRKTTLFPLNGGSYSLKCEHFKLRKSFRARSCPDCLCLAPGRRVVKSSALRFCVFYLLDFIDIFSSAGGFPRRDVVSTGNVCQTV